MILLKCVKVGVHFDCNRPISFNFVMMIEATEFNILMSVWMTLTFIQGHS